MNMKEMVMMSVHISPLSTIAWVMESCCLCKKSATQSVSQPGLFACFRRVYRLLQYPFSVGKQYHGSSRVRRFPPFGGTDQSHTSRYPAVTAVLDAVLPGKGLAYSVVSEKSIVISEKKSKEATVYLGSANRITGVVTDQTGLPVIGANIVEKGKTVFGRMA